MATFIVDCKYCKAKVAAVETGRAEESGFDDEAGEPHGRRLYIGKCPRCSTLLAGFSYQSGFEGYDSEFDTWSDVERIFPEPEKVFSSYRIPRVVTNSLNEGSKSLQAGAIMASCVMFGRALEAICRDKLADPDNPNARAPMLGQGIRELKAKNIIDQRLFDWSTQLQAFRNIAAHASEDTISREDAEDLKIFVYAITEYIYDLADRYEEFKLRVSNRRNFTF